MEAKEVRLTVTVREDLRDALKLEATLRGVEMGEIVNRLIEESLTESLERVRAASWSVA